MSDYTTRARVELDINGQKAIEKLAELEKRADNLRDAIAAAAKAGDKVELKKLRAELRQTEKEIRQVRSATLDVDNVMRRLDKATPKELNETLRSLNKQLQNIERGSKAWDEQTVKIREVKKALREVSDETKIQDNFWDRFAKKLNDYQTAIAGIVAAGAGIIGAGRSAVNAYADMDQEMANVRKYTGMNKEQVAALNEEFKKMDTRTSREQLNQLAGEAGRLGKTSQEDVMGFVRAADQINVALDELGDNATLTLSKLTGIFGDEERLGTERSLLAVGSVINELSQNCSASAPYLAEFASRMGSVGSLAGMTVPQIMGFGAVLDSNNQKVEASSTALAQVITRIYQDPAKYAKVAGLDVQKFSEKVRTDMNGAIIELLETLSNAGKMDTLAPMFKDMGENGARAISALSTLAGHIDEVKSQQKVANKAFAEGTSVTKEFRVQNSTAKAELDKARKRVTELAVELGEKLQPVMKHVLSSTTAILKVMSTVITFISQNIGVIKNIAITLAAYTVVANVATIRTKALAAWTAIVTTAHKVWNAVLATGKGLVLAYDIVVAKATGNIVRMNAAQRLLNATTKANPWGVAAAAVAALVIGIVHLVKKSNELSQSEKNLQDIRTQARSDAQDQIDRINNLRKAAQNEALAESDRLKACKQLNDINKDFNAGIDKTTGKYKESTKAVKDYIKQLIRQYEVEGAKDKLKELGRKKANTELDKKEAEKKLKPAQNELAAKDKKVSDKVSAGVNPLIMLKDFWRAFKAENKVQKYQNQINKADETIANIEKQIKDIYDLYGEDIQKSELTEEEKPNGTPDIILNNNLTNNDDKATQDPLAAEKKWREEAEALERISYATGKQNYQEYTDTMLEIANQYYEQVLARTDLSEDERLKTEVEYYENKKKQQDEANKKTLDDENKAYAQQVAAQKQRYIDGETDHKTYTEAIEQLEMQHLRAIIDIKKKQGEDSTTEESQYQDKLIANQQRHQKEVEDAQKRHQDTLKAIKDEYFGLSAAENKVEYDTQLAALNEVYAAEIEAAQGNADEKLRIEEAFQKAKAALEQKYNQGEQHIATSMPAKMQKAVQDSVDWLNSDGGKAVTESFNTVVSSMSSIFSQLTTIVQTELQIQTAAIERRYSAEISAAEGNNYKVKQLEMQRDEETKRAKREANRKQFSMQVMQAIAQTAQGAIAAYSSAAAIPVVGWVLAPIAAASAVAAGMLQVQAIKKQQQASEASGYEQGGFTPKGPANKEVGVVHAGEWVASQRLLANSTARAIINTLDYAQRTNTMPSLSPQDVSRSVTAPTLLATTSQDSGLSVSIQATAVALSAYTATMQKMQQRLNEPFVTVNTVTGDTGIQRAQDEYSRLMKNKAPRNR